MNIRSIYIDFDKNILEINGFPIKKKTVAYLPRDDGWEISKLFTPPITQPKNATVFVLLKKALNQSD